MVRAGLLALAACGALLGALWLLQGLGLVHVKPILCAADCEEVRGPSVGWAIAGFVLASASLAGMLAVLRRRS